MHFRSLFTRVLVLVMLGASASAAPTTIPAFKSGYDLQELCFRGNDPDTPEGLIEARECLAYVVGAIDSVIAVAAVGGHICADKPDFEQVMTQLSGLFKRTTDYTLRNTPAGVVVVSAYMMTPSGDSCFSYMDTL